MIIWKETVLAGKSISLDQRSKRVTLIYRQQISVKIMNSEFNLISKTMKKILLLGFVISILVSCAQLSKKEIHIHLDFRNNLTFSDIDSVHVMLDGRDYSSGNSNGIVISGAWLDTDKLTLQITREDFNSVTREVSLQSYVDDNQDVNEFDIYVDTIYLIPN